VLKIKKEVRKAEIKKRKKINQQQILKEKKNL
jgi:hypothetical protein